MLTKSTTCEIPDPYGYPEESYAKSNMKKMCHDQGLCQWFMNTRMCEGRDQWSGSKWPSELVVNVRMAR